MVRHLQAPHAPRPQIPGKPNATFKIPDLPTKTHPYNAPVRGRPNLTVPLSPARQKPSNKPNAPPSTPPRPTPTTTNPTAHPAAGGDLFGMMGQLMGAAATNMQAAKQQQLGVTPPTPQKPLSDSDKAQLAAAAAGKPLPNPTGKPLSEKDKQKVLEAANNEYGLVIQQYGGKIILDEDRTHPPSLPSHENSGNSTGANYTPPLQPLPQATDPNTPPIPPKDRSKPVTPTSQEIKAAANAVITALGNATGKHPSDTIKETVPQFQPIQGTDNDPRTPFSSTINDKPRLTDIDPGLIRASDLNNDIVTTPSAGSNGKPVSMRMTDKGLLGMTGLVSGVFTLYAWTEDMSSQYVVGATALTLYCLVKTLDLNV